MNTYHQHNLKLQARIDQVMEFGWELLKDMWRQLLAQREARVRFMTDGHLDERYGDRPR